MVTPVSSFGRSGLSDWVAQRVSAIILLAYIIVLGVLVISTPEMNYQEWQAIFARQWVKIFTLMAMLGLCAHAWIGLWTVATDYFTARMLGSAATFIRFVFLLASLTILFVYLIWCIQILWGS